MMNLTLLQKSFSKLASHKSIFFSADMPSDDVSKNILIIIIIKFPKEQQIHSALKNLDGLEDTLLNFILR